MAEAKERAAGDSPVAPPRSADAAPAPPPREGDPAERVAAALRSIGAPAKAGLPGRGDGRNIMLDQLVYGDNDLVGLIAYSMHEVNRRDWRLAYEAGNGRPPSDAEFNAYLVGEQLERRLDTYRRLAEDALAKVAQGGGDATFRRLAEAEDAAHSLASLSHAAQPHVAPAPAGPPHAASLRTLAVPAPALTAGVRPVEPMTGLRQSSKKSGELGKLAMYLFFLLITVAALAYLLRFGVDATQPRR